MAVEAERSSGARDPTSPTPREAPPPRYYLSPVDYEAWRKGYTPPSTHVLIHELMFNDAKPIMSSDSGGAGAWWFVVRGPFPSKEARLAIFKILCEDDWSGDGGAKLPPLSDAPSNGMNPETPDPEAER